MFGKAVRLAGLRISECKVFGYSQSYKKGAGISMDKKSVIRFASLDGCFNIRVITSAALRNRIGRTGN